MCVFQDTKYEVPDDGETTPHKVPVFLQVTIQQVRGPCSVKRPLSCMQLRNNSFN